MGETEYFFDGLDEFEKQLSKMIEKEYPQEFKKMVLQIADELQGKVKQLTPKSKHGGRLRDGWKVGDIEKRGNEYYIEVYNNVEYAEHVEYGHRTRGGKSFVEGTHMLDIALSEVNQRLPRHLQTWLRDFISTHNF